MPGATDLRAGRGVVGVDAGLSLSLSLGSPYGAAHGAVWAYGPTQARALLGATWREVARLGAFSLLSY